MSNAINKHRPKYLPPWDGSIPWMFDPRGYQKDVWNYLADGGKNATLIWHRRAGKDFFGMQWMWRCCIDRPGTYWHVFPNYAQGHKSIWNGRTKHTTPEMRYLDYIPIEVRDCRNGGSGINNADLTVTYHPDLGGSIYSVIGADKPESLVGAGISGVIYSEYDLMPQNTHSLIRPMLRESNGWAIYLYTPHGRNHGYDHWERVRQLPQNQHYTQLLTVEDTQMYSGWDIDALIQEELDEGMSEEKIQSEYFCSFDAPQEGAIFGEEMKKADDEGRIGDVRFDPDLPVNTAWDWGTDDHTCIWFFQIHGDDIIFIDFYTNNNKGMPFYAGILGNKPYHYGTHYVPWDMATKESNGLTRIENARSYGLTLTLNARSSVQEKIEGGRSLLRRCHFDKVKCYEGIANLRTYHREFDEKTNRFTDKPCHDYSSHAADAFMEAARVVRFMRNRAKSHQRVRNYARQNRGGYVVKI